MDESWSYRFKYCGMNHLVFARVRKKSQELGPVQRLICALSFFESWILKACGSIYFSKNEINNVM